MLFRSQRAADSFQKAWAARLGLAIGATLPKEHWSRIKALNRKISTESGVDYDSLRPVADLVARITEEVARLTGLAAGNYAVSIHHDEDADGKLKTNFIGMPKEGVGISNNPGGIPSFGKSQVQIGPGSAIAITMRYL